MSIMMGSCNVMRGSKTGLETRIGDIDGDAAHHVHNSAKHLVCHLTNTLKIFVMTHILTFNGRKICENIFDIFA